MCSKTTEGTERRAITKHLSLLSLSRAAKTITKSYIHYSTKRLHFSVCVNCNRLQMTSQRVKTKEYGTRRSRVAWLLFFTRCDVFCDLLQYTYNKNSNGLLNDLGGMKNGKTSPLTWSVVDCSLIDYGRQTMKMLTEQMPRCCININITRGRSLTITKYNKKMILHCGSCYLN